MAIHPEAHKTDNLDARETSRSAEKAEQDQLTRKRLGRSALGDSVGQAFQRSGYYKWDIYQNPGQQSVETLGPFQVRSDPHYGFTDAECHAEQKQPYRPYFSFVDGVEITSPGIILVADSKDGAFKLYFRGDHIDSSQRIYLGAGQRCVGLPNTSSGRYFAKSIAMITRQKDKHIWLDCRSFLQASSTIPASFISSIQVFNHNTNLLLASFPILDTKLFYVILTEEFSELEVAVGESFRVEVAQEMMGRTDSVTGGHFGSTLYLTLAHEIERIPQ